MHPLFTIIQDQERLWSLGEGMMGQLGHGTKIFREKLPVQIRDLNAHKIVKYACGENHAFAINDQDELFGWGEANYGKLGIIIDKKRLKILPFAS